jgi:membrane protein
MEWTRRQDSRAEPLTSNVTDARPGLALLSGTIAYFLMFSLVPALTAFILLYSVAVSPAAIQSAMASFVGGLPPSAAQLLIGLVNNILQSSTGDRYLGGLVSLIFALWGVLGGAGALLQSIELYTAAVLPTGFIRQKWRAFLVAIHLFVAVTATSAAIILMARATSIFPKLGGAGPLIIVAVGWLLLFVILAWLFSSTYRTSGVRALDRGGVSKGGATGALLFMVGTFLFGIYIANFGKYNASYGALAGIIVLLLWLRLAAAAILWGSGIDNTRRGPV